MERLVFVSGPMQGRLFELSKPEITVGREPNNRLQLLGDRCVSRRHARFVRSVNGLYIEDLGSKNGTFVNGTRIAGSIQISPGDHIQMAYHEIRVEWSPMAFGPVTPVEKPEEVPQVELVLDRTWLLGLVPSMILAPVGVLFFKLSGFELFPFALVLTGLAFAFVGLIRFFRPIDAPSAFERAFIQTLSGSALTIVGALWLNSLR